MKKLLSAIICLTAIPSFAFRTINLQGTEFRADTAAHYYFGPGMTHTHLVLTTTGRTVQVYASTLDKNDPSYTDAAKPRVEIGMDRCRTAERATEMARRKTTADRQFLAGINGDFFITSSFAQMHEFGNAILGYPNMSCVIDGKIAAPDMIDKVSRENALIIGSEGMWIDATDLVYKLLNKDGSTQVKAEAVNYPRRDNELMVYNSYMGETTSTAAGGREIALRLADGAKWRVNGSVSFVVDGDWSTAGNMAIPADGIVISCGKDYANEWIDGLRSGDTVKLKIILSLPAFEGIKPDVQHVVGGDVRILNQGKVTTEAIRWINTPTSQYGRSLTGYSEDRSKLVMAAVDAGGASGSSGLTYFESADLMAALGCYDALDLDGGGSTMTFVQPHGIVNHLRDGSERAVGNGLFFTIDAPADAEVTSIRFADHAVKLPCYGKYAPVIYGYNKSGQLVDIDVQGFELDAAGAAEAHGSYIIADKAGCFALVARKGAMTASVPVAVDEISAVVPAHENILIDGYRKVLPSLQAEVDGVFTEVPAGVFAWQSSDPSVVAVDAISGEISGVANGEATVTGVRGDAAVSIGVKVEIAPAQFVAVDENFADDSWKISASGVANYTIVRDGDTWNVSLNISRKRGLKMTFSKAMTVYSLPDYIGVKIDPHGSPLSAVNVTIEAAGARKPLVLQPQADATNGGDIRFDLSAAFDTEDIANYPILFRSLAILPASGPEDNEYHCDIAVSDFGFYYEHFASSVDNVSVDNGCKPALIVGDSEIIAGAEVESIELYNPSGMLVASAKGSVLRAPAARGVYIVRLVTATASYTSKIRF